MSASQPGPASPLHKGPPPHRLRAGYLPPALGWRDDQLQWQVLAFESSHEPSHSPSPQQQSQRLEVLVPVLSAEQAQALSQHLQTTGLQQLRAMPLAEIVDAIDRAVACLLDRDHACRQLAETWLPVVSGYDADMVRLGLSGFLKTFRAPQLRRFLAEDFANPGVLDGFVPAAKGGAVRAYGPQLLLHSWAGNVPALSLWSLICGLLVKAPSVGKLASAEPLFAGWFAQLLAQVHPPLADCLAVVWWSGAAAAADPIGQAEQTEQPGQAGQGAEAAACFYRQADTVLAYGSNQTLEQLRQRLPVTTRFLPHGHKLGFGMVAREALDALKAPALARLAAWDVMRYDQQGCYSPHVFYVEQGGQVSPRLFADYLAAELANLQRRFPRRPLALEESAGVARWQQSMEWAQPAFERIGPLDAGWSLVFCDAGDGNEPLPRLTPTALQRSIAVMAVPQLQAALPALEPLCAYLQTAGLATSPERLYSLAEQLGAVGVTRISAIGSMSMPEAGWHHDGRFSLLDLVRMSEIESSAELAAQPLASYAD